MPWSELSVSGRFATVRPLADADIPALFAITPPDTFKYFLAEPTPWSLEGFRAWLAHLLENPRTRTFLVTDTRTGAAVGCTSFMDIDAHNRSVEIGSTWYAPAARGTRINPECKLMLLRHAIEVEGCARVTLKCDARNAHSRRGIAGIGAVYEGTLRRHRMRADGFVRDSAFFGVTAEDWPRVKELLERRVGDAPPPGATAIVRPATAADVPGTLPLVRKICDMHAAMDAERFTFRPDILERYERWLPERAADPRSVYLVAEAPAAPGAGASGALGSAREIVGYIVCTIEPEVPIYWIPESGWVHDVWVEPQWRKRGVARALVSAAAERLRAIGVGRIRLETAGANDAARALFASCGFRPSTREMMLTFKTPSRQA